MSLRYSELALVVEELRRAFHGASVQKAWAPLPGLAYLEVRHHLPAEGWRSTLLCLSAEPDLARISVAAARFPSPPEPAPFQRWLRQALVGARVQELTLAGEDRIVRLEFADHALVAELIPGRGALALLGPEDRVLAVWAPGEPRPELRPGARWSPPATSLAAAARAAPSRLAGPPYAEAAEALFAEREQKARADAIRRRLEQPLRARRDRLRRTVEKVRAEADRRPEAERLRRLGELLSRNLHAVKRGQTEARLTEYAEDGAREVLVPLDPRRTPKEEVEHLFHRYRRLLRGSEAAAARLAQLERELVDAQAQLDALAAAGPEALLDRPEVLASPARGAGPRQARPFREYAGAGGGKIWVGKTGEGNDTLTFKVARPHDLWLHARGVPGAHVVIPLQRGAELPQELLLDAAHLALHHSQLKAEPRGEVSYTQAKFVRRVKDAAPGQVTYTREKTFVVRVEPDRLDRLLRSEAGEGGAATVTPPGAG